MCLRVRVHRLSRKDAAVLVLAIAALLVLSAGSARASVTPDDPAFARQWAAENTGQPVPTQSSGEQLGPEVAGTPFADASASDAWAVTTGSASIVIGEVDTGVDYLHPDLNANVWSNPGGIGQCEPLSNGCGLDGKCKGGTRGYNVLANDCEPADKDPAYAGTGHGTHVAGIMGAVGGNGLSIAGVNWHTSILPVKWLDSSTSETSTKALAQALKWLVAVKKESGVDVRVVNDSAVFPSTSNSEELKRAIEELGQARILFVAAAGNDAMNERQTPTYPCAFNLPNEICVTATNNRDELPPWANYGAPAVQLAAPGVSIYSTLRQRGELPTAAEANYGYLTGTSMAAAQVSGAAALILSAQPLLSTPALKADILAHVDQLPPLVGKVATGGRLDVCEAIPGCTDAPTQPPPPAAPPATPPAAAPSPLAVIRRLRISPAASKAARSGPAISARRLRAEAIVSYTDSEPAVTEFTVLAVRFGIENAAKKCVAPRLRGHARGRSGRRCVRYVPAGKFTRADAAGRNSFRFSAHIGRSRLAPGRYRLWALPAFAGRTGPAAHVDFLIIH